MDTSRPLAGDQWHSFIHMRRVDLCQRNRHRSKEKPHPTNTPNKRHPSKKQTNCRKYWGVLTSAFIHFARTNSRTEATPDPTHRAAYRSLLKLCGTPRHPPYAMTKATAGMATKKLRSSIPSVKKRYLGFIWLDPLLINTARSIQLINCCRIVEKSLTSLD